MIQTELVNTPHTHNPQANALDSSQAYDLVQYFRPGQNLSLSATSGCLGIFHRGTLLLWGPQSEGWEALLRRAGSWPDASMFPPPPRFANIGTGVMMGKEFVCTACSFNMAKRIANALNWYKPGKRGS